MDLVDSRCLVWFGAFKSGLDLLGREVTREVEVSAWGTSEVSHHRGDVSGESLVRIGESPIADELSSDGPAVIGHTDCLLAQLVSLLMICHARRLEWVK